MIKFYVGTHRIPHAKYFEHAFLSINIFRTNARRKPVEANDLIIDSGAFTQITTHGDFVLSEKKYVEKVRSIIDACTGTFSGFISQDYMCEDFVLRRVGRTVSQHIRMTVDRYRRLLDVSGDCSDYLIPVIQGYHPEQYLECLDLYGSDIADGAYVGVGSVCKRNTSPKSVWRVLNAIKSQRPDLSLHGFGLKATCLMCLEVLELLYSADSMAWSFAARKKGLDPNSLQEALSFERQIKTKMSRPIKMLPSNVLFEDFR